MGLRARVKDLWERKVVGCWGHSDDMDNETTQPKSGEHSIQPFGVIINLHHSAHILTYSKNVQPIMSHLVIPRAHFPEPNYQLHVIFYSSHLPSLHLETATHLFQEEDPNLVDQHLLSHVQKASPMSPNTCQQALSSATLTRRRHGQMLKSRQ